MEITDDAVREVLRDIVLQVFQKEKQARTQSAIIIAEKQANERKSRSGTPSGDVKALSSKPVSVETNAVVIRDGKAYLKGNPLQTTKEIFCPDCKLPRLLYPTSGKGARPPPDPEREYCKTRLAVIKDGHDVHGSLFASDKVNGRPKKKQAADARGGSSSPSDPDTPIKSSFTSSQKGVALERPTIPSHKCPNCPRYMTLNRIAQHLDKCMGLSGRQAGRNAMTKMTGTPSGSRAGTPKPSVSTAPGKRARTGDGDDISEGANPLKKKKLGTPKKSKLGLSSLKDREDSLPTPTSATTAKPLASPTSKTEKIENVEPADSIKLQSREKLEKQVSKPDKKMKNGMATTKKKEQKASLGRSKEPSTKSDIGDTSKKDLNIPSSR